MQVANQYNLAGKSTQRAHLLLYICYMVHMVMDCMVQVLALQKVLKKQESKV